MLLSVDYQVLWACDLSKKFFQIVHNLSRAVDIDARLSRLEERSRHVQIDDESLCDSCDARLGTKLFAMYPDDTVVCYKVSYSNSSLNSCLK